MDFISEMADAGSTEDVAVELARVARCSELFTKDGAAALKGRKRLVKAGMVFYNKGGMFRSSKALLTLLFNDCIVVCDKERAQLHVKHNLQFATAFESGSLDVSKPPLRVHDPGFSYILDRAAVLRGDLASTTVPEAFQFDVVGPDGPMSFRASNGQEKHEWVEAITKCILASTPLDLRLQGDVAGLYAHQLRNNTLHAAVAANDSDFIDLYGLCTAECVERACAELGHACYDAETLLVAPIKVVARKRGPSSGAESDASAGSGERGGMGTLESATSRTMPEVVCSASDAHIASLISALEMSARELLAVSKPGITGSGGAALAAAQAFAAGESVRDAISRSATAGADSAAAAASGAEGGGLLPGDAIAGSEAFAHSVGLAILGQEADVDGEDSCGRTPLLLAALLGRDEAARALMRAGCNVAAVDANMRTSLHIAAQRGNAAMVALLAEHGAPLNGPQATDMLGRSPLQAAVLGEDAGAAPTIVRSLVSAGANAAGTDLFGVSLIHVAVLRGPGFEGCIPALAAAGADVNGPLLEETATAAALEARQEAAELSGAAFNGAGAREPKSGSRAVVMVGGELGKGRGCGGLTPLHLACGAGQEGDGATATLLHTFAAKLDPEASDLALGGSFSAGGHDEAAGSAAASTAVSSDEALPADVAALAAAASGSPAVPAAKSLTIGLGRVSPAAVRALLAAGAKPNMRSGPASGCQAPLHMLASRVLRASSPPGSAAATAAAAAAEGTPESPGGTAVDVAAVSEAAAALASGGARPDVVDGSGKAAAHLFAECRASGLAVDIGRLLEARRARPALPAPPRAGLGLTVPESAMLRPASAAELATLRSGGQARVVAASLLARRLLRPPCSVAVLPAAFLPDEAAEVCMGCGAEFGWFVRRHHCRACNAVVCSECSAGTAPLYPPGTDVFRAGLLGGPAVAFGQERVCDGCGNKLEADAAASSSALGRVERATKEAMAGEEARDKAFKARREAQRAERDRLLASSAARAVLDDSDLERMRRDGRGGGGRAGGLAGTRAAMEGTREALGLRGEKLERMTEQSQQLAASGQDFARLARQLENQSKGKYLGMF